MKKRLSYWLWNWKWLHMKKNCVLSHWDSPLPLRKHNKLAGRKGWQKLWWQTTFNFLPFISVVTLYSLPCLLQQNLCVYVWAMWRQWEEEPYFCTLYRFYFILYKHHCSSSIYLKEPFCCLQDFLGNSNIL